MPEHPNAAIARQMGEVARRFMWFLVTALPAREDIATGKGAVLADFLEAQGEPGLAARLRQF